MDVYNISDRDKQVIQTILSKHIDPQKYSAYIFGSRATGHARKYSDVDIAIESQSPLSASKLFEIEDAFEHSDLPFIVEIVEMKNTSQKFAGVAKEHIIPLF